MKKCAITVSGDVQGVGFRFTAREKAEELGVTLHEAENLSDGSARFVVEGEDTALQKFVVWAKIGPSFARVESIEVTKK